LAGLTDEVREIRFEANGGGHPSGVSRYDRDPVVTALHDARLPTRHRPILQMRRDDLARGIDQH